MNNSVIKTLENIKQKIHHYLFQVLHGYWGCKLRSYKRSSKQNLLQQPCEQGAWKPEAPKTLLLAKQREFERTTQLIDQPIKTIILKTGNTPHI